MAVPTIVVLSLALLAGLAFRSWRLGRPNDRRLFGLAAFSLVMTFLSAAAFVAVDCRVCKATWNPALTGAIFGVVWGTVCSNVMLAASVMGRLWRPTSHSAIAPDAQDARG